MSAGGGKLRVEGGGIPALNTSIEPPASPVCIPTPPEPDHGTMTTSGTGEIEMGGGCYTIGGGSVMTALLRITGANVTVYNPQELSGSLSISGGSFVIKTPSTAADFDTLTIDGGLLENPGDIACESDFRWRGGTLSGSGQTMIAPTCTGVIDPPGTSAVTLTRQALVNQATLTWGTGGISGVNASEIRNSGVLRANSQDANLSCPGYPDDPGVLLLVNDGTLTKDTGSGITRIGCPVRSPGGISSPTGSIMFSEPDGGEASDEEGGEPLLTPDGRELDEHFLPRLEADDIDLSEIDDAIDPENLEHHYVDRDRNVYYDADSNLTVVAGEGDRYIVTTHRGEPRWPPGGKPQS